MGLCNETDIAGPTSLRGDLLVDSDIVRMWPHSPHFRKLWTPAYSLWVGSRSIPTSLFHFKSQTLQDKSLWHFGFPRDSGLVSGQSLGSRSLGQDLCKLMRGGEQAWVGAVNWGRQWGGTSHFPFCHTWNIVYHTAIRKLFVGKSSLFSTGNVPPKDSAMLPAKHRVLCQEKRKKTWCERCRSSHKANNWVRSWKRKCKRILSTSR
jgi:hypothetical protein